MAADAPLPLILTVLGTPYIFPTTEIKQLKAFVLRIFTVFLPPVVTKRSTLCGTTTKNICKQRKKWSVGCIDTVYRAVYAMPRFAFLVALYMLYFQV